MKFHPCEILAVFNGGTVAAWMYGSLAFCLITVGAVIYHRRHKTQRRRTRASVPAINTTGCGSARVSVSAKNTASNGHAWPKLMFRRKRHKRIFNHSKFYASVMRELSYHSYRPASATNGTSHADGYSHVHAASNGANINQTIKSEIEDLIAGQQSLIEKQKCLLEEQARLIEEKSRLIEEQSAFLKNQSGMVEDRRAA